MSMSKEEFLNELKKGLSGLPEGDVEERVAFYNEMISDRMEEGMSEEAAVAAAGSVESVVSQTIADTSFTKIVKERVTPGRGLKGWEVALIICGFPIWFPLIIVAVCLIFSIYIVALSFIAAFWGIELGLIMFALAGVVASVMGMAAGHFLPGLAMLGLCFAAAGAAMIGLVVCMELSKGVVWLAGKILVGIKSLFIKKGEK